MICIENVEVIGWEAAIRGMRNPMNSWGKSDSGSCISMQAVEEGWFSIGEKDLDLMKRLCNSGTDHRKFMRMITVYVDITAPLYWWKEFDTYKVGTVANSCSTMHKIHAKEFTPEDFSCEHLTKDLNDPSGCLDLITYLRNPDNTNEIIEGIGYGDSTEILSIVIQALNTFRTRYLKTKDKKYWWQLVQLLPSSYNQKRTVMLNYEVLANIYKSRKDHKLDEWRDFCKWIEMLPYSEIIIGELKEK